MAVSKNPQIELLKKEKLAFGGELLKTRAGRAQPRPLDTKNTMHLVLKSSKAKGAWSFRYQNNPQKIRVILKKFAAKYGIQLLHGANVGNHLHLHIRLRNRRTYAPFIRAVTAAIAMAVTGVNRWDKRNLDRSTSSSGDKTSGKSRDAWSSKNENWRNPIRKDELTPRSNSRLKFWDYRPFSRVVVGFRAFLNIRNYIKINRLEGVGLKRELAVVLVRGGIFAPDRRLTG